MRFPRHIVEIHEQRNRMRMAWPDFDCRLQGSLLVCRGSVTPSPINAKYDVVIRYRAGEKPRTLVEAPQLRPREDEEKIPHTFPDGSLCLSYRDQWTGEKYIAATTVPWTQEWLFFYEAWLVTGEWLGGGIHTSPKSDK